MYLPVHEAERVVDAVLNAVAPPGLLFERRLEETVDWEGSPSLTLHAHIDPSRWAEVNPELRFQIAQGSVFGLGDLGDDRVLHVRFHDAQRQTAE